MKTVKEISRLTGISVRTLHYYDEINLLKPTQTTEAGYRLYDDTVLERLHSILLFRELQFPLKEIKVILDSPDFDKQTALKEQIKLLELQRNRLDEIIASAREILTKGAEDMSFSAFDKTKIDKYAADASKYDEEKKLKIRRIYDLIPSNMENKKKRVIAQSIENKKGKTFGDYEDEFEYLISAGIALNVQAISNPVFPLIESTGKNLLKLYLNDVGILTGILYGNNIRAVLDDERSINLGAVYESVIASELIAHGYKLFYYDNRNKGEVDYLIDDYDSLSAVPIEVKSGKDYTVHSALNTFVKNEDYHIKKAFVMSNERTVTTKGKIIYIPIYYIVFFKNSSGDSKSIKI